MHRTLCPRCLSFFPSSDALLILPPAPLAGLWSPSSRLELPVVSVRETARPDPVEMWFDSGPVLIPRWLGVSELRLRTA